MNTLKNLIKEYNIRISSTYGGVDIPDDFKNSDPWKVTLKYARAQMTIPFYKGAGHYGAEPTIEEVLDCLLMDYSSWDSANDFEDWANEFGYDTDSRKAEKIYKKVEKQSRRLKQFLGDDLLNKLLACDTWEDK